MRKRTEKKSCRRRRGRPPKEIESAADGRRFAPNLGVLAEECGVDRRTIYNARKNFADDAPRKRLDGRYPVAQHKEWLAMHGVSGRRKDVDLAATRRIKLELAKLRVEREQFELDAIKGRLLPRSQIERALMKMLTAFNAALNAFPLRVNEQLEGLDCTQRAPIIQRELEVVMRTLRYDYLSAEEEDDLD